MGFFTSAFEAPDPDAEDFLSCKRDQIPRTGRPYFNPMLIRNFDSSKFFPCCIIIFATLWLCLYYDVENWYKNRVVDLNFHPVLFQVPVCALKSLSLASLAFAVSHALILLALAFTSDLAGGLAT
jgi:hypothetical protein